MYLFVSFSFRTCCAVFVFRFAFIRRQLKMHTCISNVLAADPCAHEKQKMTTRRLGGTLSDVICEPVCVVSRPMRSAQCVQYVLYRDCILKTFNLNKRFFSCRIHFIKNPITFCASKFRKKREKRYETKRNAKKKNADTVVNQSFSTYALDNFSCVLI